MDVVSKLTVGDIAIVEELSGMGISVLGDETAPKGKVMAALVYVIKRKENKDFTFKDAMEMTMDEVTAVLGIDEEDDPKDES